VLPETNGGRLVRPLARRLARLIAPALITLALAGVAVPAEAPAEVPAAAPAAPAAGDQCAGADLDPATLGRQAAARVTVCLLNRERRAHGLPALVSDRRLARAATQHSRDMVARQYFAHVSLSGATFASRIAQTGWLRNRASWVIGENLAWGSGSLATPRAIVASWMTSPAHRANVLQFRFRHVGIGISLGAPKAGVDAAATYASELGS
jgi:uncharacterized protein YkwD